MDERRLERLSRQLAALPSRREVLAAMAGMLAAGRVHGAGAAEMEAFGYCRLPGQACGQDSQCCGGRCQADGTCNCRKRGKRAQIGAICCSGKSKKGKCR